MKKNEKIPPFLFFYRSVQLKNEKKTKEFAKKFASYLQKGDYLYLSGDLGSGKTSFVRFLVQALFPHQNTDVTSPTFSLVHYYENETIMNNQEISIVVHADLYRIFSENEVIELDLLSDFKNGILCVEWAEKAGNFLPPPNILLQFSYGKSAEMREITIFLNEKTKKSWKNSRESNL